MSGAQRARETVAALYPDGVLPQGEFSRLRASLGVDKWVMSRAVVTVRADRQREREREPHESPWLSEYRRAFLDGLLAAQGYRIVQIEPPPDGAAFSFAQPPCENVATGAVADTGACK